MVKLFLGGFPLTKTELELVQLVGPYGEVSTIKIVRDKKTRICKGYAFLEITGMEGAENIMNALNGTKYCDRILTVNIVPEVPVASPPVNLRPKRPRLRI